MCCVSLNLHADLRIAVNNLQHLLVCTVHVWFVQLAGRTSKNFGGGSNAAQLGDQPGVRSSMEKAD